MAKKQISDLSVAELSDLNLSCKFVMDDSNKKTKQISFGIVESKLSSEIQKTVENSLLEKLSSSVINSGGTANFLDYSKNLKLHLYSGQSMFLSAMPLECWIQFPGFSNYNISVDGYELDEYTTHDREYPKMNYSDVAYGQSLLLSSLSYNSGQISPIYITPYLYGRRDTNCIQISTLNSQELRENDVLHMTRCFYRIDSGVFTQLTDFEKTDIYYDNGTNRYYILLIELSASENIIAETENLVAQGENLKPSFNSGYCTLRNTIFSEPPSLYEISNNRNNSGIIIPKGYILYLNYQIRYDDTLSSNPSFNDLLNGNVRIIKLSNMQLSS